MKKTKLTIIGYIYGCLRRFCNKEITDTECLELIKEKILKSGI